MTFMIGELEWVTSLLEFINSQVPKQEGCDRMR